jgi:hypothetical protein
MTNLLPFFAAGGIAAQVILKYQSTITDQINTSYGLWSEEKAPSTDGGVSGIEN